MRPTSVIFLIISILLACIGGMLCLSAVSMAEENGEVLFESVKNEDGNYVITKYFGLADEENPDNSSSKNNIKKMEFNFENVDVEIRGGQEDNKIELYNFTEGMFSYKTSVGGALSIDDLNGLLKMVSFGTSGINFKGFRNLLFYREYADLDRKVIVYLKDDSNVTNISCSVKDGSITVKDITVTTDITISSDSGDITVSNLFDHSSLNITVGSGSVLVEDSNLYAIKVRSGSAPVDVKNCPVQRSLSIDADNADVTYDHMALDFEGFDVEFKAGDGRLMLNDEIISTGKFIFNGAPDKEETEAPETDEDGNPVEDDEDEETVGEEEYIPNSITISVTKGNLTVTNNEPPAPEVPDNGTDETPDDGTGEDNGNENPDDPTGDITE